MQLTIRSWSARRLFYYVAAFIFLTIMVCPDLFSYYPAIRYVRILQNCLSCIAVLLLAYYYRNRFIRTTLYLFGAFLLATIINNSNLPSVLYYFSKSFGLIVVLYYFLHMESRAFWRVLSDYFALAVYLNTLITLLYPQGFITAQSINLMDKGIFLLGERNQIMPYYLISIAVSKIYFEYTGEKQRRGLFLFVCCMISEYFYKSSTAAIGIAVFAILYFTDFTKILSKVKKMSWSRRRLIAVGGGIAFLYYLVVVYRIQNKLSDLIYFLFKKDATFSTRTIIWDYALRMIKESPVFGYGGTATKYITVGRYVFNCHNVFLQVMIMGGGIMTVIFIWMIIQAINNTSKILRRNIQKPYIALLVAVFIMSLTEVYAISLVVFILFLPIIIVESDMCFQNTE